MMMMMMMTKKTQHDLEVMIGPSSQWKMQKTTTTVHDLVVVVPVAAVEVTIYSSCLWKTQKKNPS